MKTKTHTPKHPHAGSMTGEPNGIAPWERHIAGSTTRNFVVQTHVGESKVSFGNSHVVKFCNVGSCSRGPIGNSKYNTHAQECHRDWDPYVNSCGSCGNPKRETPNRDPQGVSIYIYIYVLRITSVRATGCCDVCGVCVRTCYSS